MHTLSYSIKQNEQTTIALGNGILDSLDTLLKPYSHTGYILLCDTTTETLFGEKVQAILKKLGKPVYTISVKSGEQSKNFDSLKNILESMHSYNLDRKSALIGLGGGVVGDVATVAAGLYYRGIDCIQIPTTLLSMVDSALGGKGAVNLGTYKNTLGIIRQPKLAIIDPLLLEKLPKEQLSLGMGEVVKYAIAMDKDLFEKLKLAQELNNQLLESVIKRCIELKMEIVEKDPQDEKGIREVLNFGHTLGQAIELLLNIPHGHAISVGMNFAIKLSLKMNLIENAQAKECLALIERYKLPITTKKLDGKKVLEQLKKDKKTINNNLRFVLLGGIGSVITGQTVSEKNVLETLQEVMQ